ncbi:MAG: SDR family oxidoreductase [Clostridia bacterium]|jgi:short-subunit dehydrogenase|nr:SDR family oxidoreductase [Clostridia bacterium]
MNKNIVITGATSGISKEFAKLFVSKGDSLLLISRDEEKLHNLCLQFEGKKSAQHYRYIQADLSKPDEAKRVCSELNGEKIDILINNAGFGMTGAFADADISQIEKMMVLNMFSLTLLTKAAVKQMVKQKHGFILNVASVASFMPNPFGNVYAATKAYVRSFSEALSEELKGTGVFVSVLCPGPTKTNFGERSNMNQTKVFSGKVMLPETVVKIAYREMMSHRIEIIPGMQNRLTVRLSKVFPKSFVLKVTARQLKL